MAGSKNGFSVIIPVYNGSGHIKTAIESCLQQTVLPGEIIIVDDGSEDDTGTIVAGISSDRIVYIKNKKNNGPAYSRNIGMRIANYQWIVFLDADDSFHPQKIEVIDFCTRQNSSIKAIGHSFRIQGQPLFVIPGISKESIQPVQLTSGQVLLSNKIVTPALVVAADNDIFFNDDMHYAEDHDFILRTTEKYGTWYINMPLCTLGRVPLTAGGMTANRWRMRKGEINMYIDYCKRKKIMPAAPFFIMFSLLKHLKNALFYRGSK